jgi:peptide/nickel transport system substrate-binding protein/oligopeptide transport system substrate-binding protein
VVRLLDLGPNAGDLGSLDPVQIAFGSDYNKAQLVFPELITLDDAGKPLDWAAKSYEVSPNGLTYTFHLHSGMQWSDGSPIDATTFAYSINRALDPCIASAQAYYLENIKGAVAFNKTQPCVAGADGLTTTSSLIGKSIVVSDRLTLELTLEAPTAYFLSELSYPTSWGVPKQLIDKYGQSKWIDHLADGAGFGGGLYKVTRWDHNGRFWLGANTAFWGQKPIIQTIEWTLYKDAGTAWADYLVGIGDVGYPPPTSLTSARRLAGYNEVPTLSVRYLRVNWALAPFDDVRVRNAFSLAIDRKALVTSIDKGGAAPTIHMVIQGIPGYNPNLKNATGDSGDKALVSNMSKAQQLASAYAADKCGGDFSRCAPIIYTYPTVSSAELLRAQVLQQEWQTAFPGWQITLQGLELSALFSTAAKQQLGWGGWTADYPDPQDFLSILWAKDAPFNASSVNIPAADALEQQGDTSSDATSRLALYQHAEQLLIDQGAFIAYEQPLRSYVVRPSSKLVKWRINGQGGTSLVAWQQAYIAA